MSKEHLFAIKFHKAWLTVYYHATLPFKIVKTPYVVVAGEEMYLDTLVRKFSHFAEKASISLWNNILEFVPEVKHIAQHIHSRCIVLYFVEE